MFALGDIVSIAGRARRMMAVDTDGLNVTCAWKTPHAPARERVVHQMNLVLLQTAPYPPH